MAKLSFRQIVLNALADAGKKRNGTPFLSYEDYQNSPTGDSPWKFIARCEAVIAGCEADGEIPPFMVVSHRRRKMAGIEFPQVIQPLDPDQGMKESTKKKFAEAEAKGIDPTTLLPTNYWPAVVVMTDDLRKTLEKAQSDEDRAKTATSDMVNWFRGDTSSKVLSAKPGVALGTYVVTLEVNTLAKGQTVLRSIEAPSQDASQDDVQVRTIEVPVAS